MAHEQTTEKPAEAAAPASTSPPAGAAPAPSPAASPAASPALGTPSGSGPTASNPPPGGSGGGESRPRRRGLWRTIANFISANTNVVASFVIGAAGLLSTTLYQCNQSDLSRRQAEANMNIAREQAENSWRIERAKILSQNLQALTARGDGNVEQRYGVLLSLSRGSILEPDVAVSYALELGRDNPDYMSSVLSNIERKDKVFYRRLLAAYELSCRKKFGISSQLVAACKGDKLSGRSDALADFTSDELEAVLLSGRSEGPLYLLGDEREVEASLQKLLGLFTPFLHEMYERRQWQTIEKFMASSPSAKLIGAFVLATASDGIEGSMERGKISAFRAQIASQVDEYLSNGTDAEIRIRLLNYVLSHLLHGQEIFVPALRRMLSRPRREIEPLVARMNTRLLWCQIDPLDGPLLRDLVLVPTLTEQAQKAQPDLALVDDLIGLISLLPEPAQSTPAWSGLLQVLGRLPGSRYPKLYTERRAMAQQQRKIADAAPPAAPPLPVGRKVTAGPPAPVPPSTSEVNKKSFCQVQDETEEEGEEEE